MQTPQYQVDSLNALQELPITAAGAPSQTLGAIANIQRITTPAVYSQYNILPMVQIYGTTQGRDLGAVAADVQKVIDAAAKGVPKGVQVVLLGQVRTMNSAFFGLLFGLLGAIVLIYLLIVVNFQSWGDPFVIITALPAALAGIIWMLFATHTTLSVPALTGAIMCMGVATANSVLVISFAREQLELSGDPVGAALEAGFVRFRPVLMTALAMIIGMSPMALRRAERAARPRRRRRPHLRDDCNADVRSGRLQYLSRAPKQDFRAASWRNSFWRKSYWRMLWRLNPIRPPCRAADYGSPRYRRAQSPLSSSLWALRRAEWPTPSSASGRRPKRSRWLPSPHPTRPAKERPSNSRAGSRPIPRRRFTRVSAVM
jgi:hypothetical protein